MKEIVLAKTAGFCFGVNRAVNIVYELLEKNKNVTTLGPIIHNPQMVAELESKGVKIASSPEEADKDSTLVIRSHGVSENTMKKIKELDLQFVDATCPFVSKIHKIVLEASLKNHKVMIAGDKDHPEVKGIMGHCKTEIFVFKNLKELLEIIEKNNNLTECDLTFVAQTTFDMQEWKKCVEIVKKVYKNALLYDTICNATSARQKEAESLSSASDLMYVIGGKQSSNTKKLFDICKNNCENTFFIETPDEMQLTALNKAKKIGITAGASTPAKIIKEVLDKMSENIKSGDVENFAEMFEESIKNANTDQKVKGVVVKVTPTEVYVDIGRKQTGIVPLDELTYNPSESPEDLCKVGDEIEVLIMKTNDQDGTILLSKKKIDSKKNNEVVVKALESKEILTGVVTEINKGGLVVNVLGVRVFVPRSQATLRRDDNLEELLKKTVSLRITEVDGPRKVIGSIRNVLAEERKAKLDEFWNNLNVGDTFVGEVKNIKDYGVFVDLGLVQGMVHISELSWLRIKHPTDVVKVGSTLKVFVKSFDKEKRTISLGYKKDEDNPWTILKTNYAEGDVVKAEIVGMTDFGAFARVIPGIEGLIHVSQISDRRVEKPQDALTLGQEVEAKIIGIDFDAKRVSLSMRALLVPEEAEATEEVKEEVEELTEE